MKALLIIISLLPLFTFSQVDRTNALIDSKIDLASEHPVQNILIQLDHLNQRRSYSAGVIIKGEELIPVTGNEQFKVASSTKLFVSTIVLQLMEEEKLGLDEKASKYLENISFLDFENLHTINDRKFADEITINNLLSHRTGLADIYTDKEEEFFDNFLKNPDKRYSSELIIDLYYNLDLNKISHNEPNKGWYYSDMNYVLLGLIIEQIEKKSLAQIVRNRILEPLQMRETYFEFYEEPLQKPNLIDQYVGNLNFSQMNTSFDWSGGGLISTNNDMIIFIKSLFNSKLVNRQSLEKMIDVKFSKSNEDRYGLGIYETNYNGNIYFGHYGFYGTYVGYCPETKTALSYSINQAMTKFSNHDLISEILELNEE